MYKISVWAMAALVLGASYTAAAATAIDVGNALMEARSHLIALLAVTEKAEQDAFSRSTHETNGTAQEESIGRQNTPPPHKPE